MMCLRTLLLTLSLCLSFTAAKVIQDRAENIVDKARSVHYATVCKKISQSTSALSKVYFVTDSQYTSDIIAWSATNTAKPACVVEPGTSKDVAATLRVLGAYRAKFAVKSGGHSTNAGFSSTTGVLVSMRRFSSVKYDRASKTAVIGSGMIWDNVFKALQPYKVSVLGARSTGIGVGGFLLGGGYSYKTNQYGLAIDTVTAFELVQPNGKVITVTAQSYPDLFFGLKGGFNNYGIVTKFTVKTFPQTDVWGGVMQIDSSALSELKAAIADFTSKDRDPKAEIMTAFNYAGGKFIILHVLFYDGPSPPAGLFDKFLKIKHTASDVSRRSLLSMVRALPSDTTLGLRNTIATVPISKYSPPIVNAIINETTFWGTALAKKSGAVASYVMEPFRSDILSHNNNVATAYPADRSHMFSPLFIHYAWAAEAADVDAHAASSASQSALQSALMKDGQILTRDAAFYPNYALSDTPLVKMYGKNVPKLKALKKKVDPENVMGLAGGFKF